MNNVYMDIDTFKQQFVHRLVITKQIINFSARELNDINYLHEVTLN